MYLSTCQYYILSPPHSILLKYLTPFSVFDVHVLWNRNLPFRGKNPNLCILGSLFSMYKKEAQKANILQTFSMYIFLKGAVFLYIS